MEVRRVCHFRWPASLDHDLTAPPLPRISTRSAFGPSGSHRRGPNRAPRPPFRELAAPYLSAACASPDALHEQPACSSIAACPWAPRARASLAPLARSPLPTVRISTHHATQADNPGTRYPWMVCLKITRGGTYPGGPPPSPAQPPFTTPTSRFPLFPSASPFPTPLTLTHASSPLSPPLPPRPLSPRRRLPLRRQPHLPHSNPHGGPLPLPASRRHVKLQPRDIHHGAHRRAHIEQPRYGALRSGGGRGDLGCPFAFLGKSPLRSNCFVSPHRPRYRSPPHSQSHQRRHLTPHPGSAQPSSKNPRRVQLPQLLDRGHGALL